MFSTLKPYIQLGSVIAVSSLAGCSTERCSSEVVQSQCDGHRSKLTAQEIEEAKAEMKTLGVKFGYDYEVYRFSHEDKMDLNGNQSDDWLLIRTPTGRRHHVVDSSIILDWSIDTFAPAKLGAFMESFFMETPDEPSRTTHNAISGGTPRVYATTDNPSAKQFGAVLPGAVTFIRRYQSADEHQGFPVTEVNFPLNASMAQYFYVTAHDQENCASQVWDAFSVQTVEEGKMPDVAASMLAPHNKARGGVTVQRYR